jgi:hypothetical protein
VYPSRYSRRQVLGGPLEIGTGRRWGSGASLPRSASSPACPGTRCERPRYIVVGRPFNDCPVVNEIERGSGSLSKEDGLYDVGVRAKTGKKTGWEEEPVKPLGRLVRLGFTCCHASTCRLST